ncbi:MAG: family 78 glycoside hydrolase catalytic domain [Clostridia bacterium]|nr:family 78 glycoside hydrolase catalytic domain [Clostridia bacterium]
MTLYDLRTCHMEQPLGIDLTPEFSWKLQSEKRDVLQESYRIVLRDDTGLPIWDSGPVASRQQSFIPLDGVALRSRTHYTWTVTVTDNYGETSEGSASFETGLLSRKDWEAAWVGSTIADETSVLFEKTVVLPSSVQKARLYATCYGVYRLLVNGERPDDREFAPEFTTYQKRLCYQTYDVANLLSEGENRLQMLVGDGWYFSPQAGPVTDRPVERPAILLQLEVCLEDGTQKVYCSDGTETCRRDHIVSTDLFQGETQDFSLAEQPSLPVEVLDLSFDILRAQAMPPVRPAKELQPERIYTSPKGETIVDFGQLLAGRARLRFQAPKGTEVVLEYFETTDPEGNYLNTMYALQKDVVISGGTPLWYEACFTFHGFRYLRITGLPDLQAEQITAVLLTTEKENAGTFETSDERLNRLYRNVRWSQYNNMMSVPTDCPGREKGAYTGDLLIYCKTAMWNEEMTPFLRNWMQNVADDQLDTGVIPITAPFTKLYNTLMTNLSASFQDTEMTGVAGWSDAAVWIPYTMYQMTGNTLVLEEFYPTMKRWTDWVLNRAQEKQGDSDLSKELDRWLWNTGFHFGEWLIPSEENGHGQEFETAKRSSRYTAPFFGYRTVSLMAEIAEVLQTEDAAPYRTAAGNMKEAIQEGLLRGNRLPNDRMGACVLALAFDLVPDDLKEEYHQTLLKLIAQHDGCLDTGFLATPFLLDVLCDLGETELAHHLLWNDRRPSWLYEVDHGATAIWEAWDADDARENGRIVSYQHYAFGCVDDWMCRHLAGIDTVGAGCREWRIAPEPDDRIPVFQRTYESEAGTLAVSRDGDVLSVTVPCNTTAVVSWIGKTMKVGSGTYQFAPNDQ